MTSSETADTGEAGQHIPATPLEVAALALGRWQEQADSGQPTDPSLLRLAHDAIVLAELRLMPYLPAASPDGDAL